MTEPNLLHTLTQQPKTGAVHTSSEILQQPLLWQKLWSTVQAKQERISQFLHTALKATDYIIFTGAGTSAFIGLSLHGLYFRQTGLLSQAVATTDIVSHPADYFDKDHHPLIISFARSGNSPESIAALQLADKYSARCHHLIITCDPNGALAGFQSDNNCFVFVLPAEANDKGLAMTSSYSAMLLTAILLVHLDDLQAAREQIELLAHSTNQLFEKETNKLYALAGTSYDRAIFLGSGPLLGTATEAQLKLQELTDGKIICKADSYLGFRHGPKAVLNGQTLIIFFLSASEKVRRYELDLIRTILEEGGGLKKKKSGTITMSKIRTLRTLVVAPNKEALKDIPEIPGIQLQENNESGVTENTTSRFSSIVLNSQVSNQVSADYQPVGAIVVGQLLALFASLHHHNTPDSPSANGAISRVVEGVTIYPDRDSSGDIPVAKAKIQAGSAAPDSGA